MNDKIKPRKKPSQARSKERVNTILSATYALLQEQGLAAVTTARIAKKAQIPIGSLYQYFPNKKAIFVSLYDDYLAGIRDVLDTFEKEPYTDMDWRTFFTAFFTALEKKENERGIAPELVQAFNLYPEMQDQDKLHSEIINDRIANLFKQHGFGGSKQKLMRLSKFLYSVNEGLWLYRIEVPSKHFQESVDWGLASTFGILEHYRSNQ